MLLRVIDSAMRAMIAAYAAAALMLTLCAADFTPAVTITMPPCRYAPCYGVTLLIVITLYDATWMLSNTRFSLMPAACQRCHKICAC